MPQDKPLGVILAGGSARRMGGGDKGLLPLGGQRMLDHVIDRFGPQVDRMVLNAAGDPARFEAFGLETIADEVPDQGPLGGVLAGLDHAALRGLGRIATVAADMPFLPADLVARLEAAGPLALAEAGGRLHPVCGLWPTNLRHRLRADLSSGTRRVADWALAQGAGRAAFDAPAAFFNVNTLDDLSKARQIWQARTV